MSHEPDFQARICRICHTNPALPGRKQCAHCRLTERLERLLDDGTGAINPALIPLAEHLSSTPNPMATLAYTYKRIAPLLQELATGQRPLTHDGMDYYPHRRQLPIFAIYLLTARYCPR